MSNKGFSSFNKSRVLGAVWLHDNISRSDIARLTGLDRSTVSIIVSSFISAGLVLETSEGTSTLVGGRKPVHLSLNREFGYVLGVEIQPEGISSVTVDLYGSIVHERKFQKVISLSNIIPAFLEFVRPVLEEMEAKDENLLGIGVGVAGIVDPVSGTVRKSIPLGIVEPFSFVGRVSTFIDVPVFLENDVNACAWGELAFRRTERLTNFLSILLEFREKGSPDELYGGIGAGLGIVIGGKVYYGEDFSAGEFRSIFAPEGSENQFSLTREEQFMVKRDRAVFEKFAHELSANIALLVNSFNLRQVFLVCSTEINVDDLCVRMREHIQGNWSYPEPVDVTVSPSGVGEYAVAFGSAGMFLEHFFNGQGTAPGHAMLGFYGVDLLLGQEFKVHKIVGRTAASGSTGFRKAE